MTTKLNEQLEGICNLCHNAWGTGDYCKTVHNHCHDDGNDDDLIICCKCFCKTFNIECPDASEYKEKEKWEVLPKKKKQVTYKKK